MSTLKVTAITDTSGGNTTTINSMTPTADSLQGFRNRIINGAMMIDQRNAGASVTPSGDPVYTLDRWYITQSQNSKFSIQQNAGSVTPPVGFSRYLGTTVVSAVSVGASDYFALAQAIEGFNIADLNWGTANAKTVTLSFWVRSSLTGTFGGALRNTTGNLSYPFTYTISAANTWEQKTITIVGPTTGTWNSTNTEGVIVRFGLGAGSTFSGTAGSWATQNSMSATGATSVVGTNGATFYITGVQLEVGSTATPFERRPYGTELMLCQRYLPAYLGSSLSVQYQGQATSTTAMYVPIPHPVTTRVAPTGITTSSMSAIVSNSTGGGVTVTGLTFTQAGVSSTFVQATVASGLTAGNASYLVFNSGTLLLTGCEL